MARVATTPTVDRCDQCEELMINGIRCHETGCPNAWKGRTCRCYLCGCSFLPEYSGQRDCLDCMADGQTDTDCE